MRFLPALAFMVALSIAAAIADPAAPPPDLTPKTSPITMTLQESMIVTAALANAGAACDANVAVYCQIATLRASVLSKVTKAANDLRSPAPEKKP